MSHRWFWRSKCQGTSKPKKVRIEQTLLNMMKVLFWSTGDTPPLVTNRSPHPLYRYVCFLSNTLTSIKHTKPQLQIWCQKSPPNGLYKWCWLKYFHLFWSSPVLFWCSSIGYVISFSIPLSYRRRLPPILKALFNSWATECHLLTWSQFWHMVYGHCSKRCCTCFFPDRYCWVSLRLQENDSLTGWMDFLLGDWHWYRCLSYTLLELFIWRSLPNTGRDLFGP